MQGPRRKKKVLIAVIGGHSCQEKVEQISQKIGKIVAKVGGILICGGLGGVMQAAAQGAKSENGITVGILPGREKKAANPYIDIPIATGMGIVRNAIVVGCADLVIALPGEYGTLSEIGLALNMGKVVLGWEDGEIPGVRRVNSLRELKEIIEGFVKRGRL